MLLNSRFREALLFANDLHAAQLRKGKPVPYISHLLAVCSLVLENGGSEDQAIAALLHDAVEDQGGQATLDIIRQRFGEEVARIVSACSDSDTLPKPPWRQRKEEYLAHLRTAGPEVRLVSLADKVHNARSVLFDYREIGPDLWRRFKGGKVGTLWYYSELSMIFDKLGPQPLASELTRLVRDLNELVLAREG